MNYAALAERTQKLIAKFGKPLTLRHYGEAVYDAATMTYTPGVATDIQAVAVESAYTEYETDGTNVRAGDVKLLVSSKVEPTAAMKVVMGGIEWEIVRIIPLRLADIALIYTIQARQP